MILVLYKNLKYLGGWAGKSAMADATKTTARHIGHMTYTQGVKHFSLILFHSASEKLLFSLSNMQICDVLVAVVVVVA